MRQPDWPRLMLKLAVMSTLVGSMSAPESLLTRAFGYQWPPTGAPEKSRKISVGPALPRIAEFAVQGRLVQTAETLMVTLLARVAPHLFAAA